VSVDVDDSASFAAAVGTYISDLGGGFMISAQAKAFGKDNGLRGRQAYVLGRGSVLGDVDADVVTSAFGFWPADVVRESWDAARAVMSVADARAGYSAACHDWGVAHYSSFAGAARLAELLEWIVDGTDVAGLPLYAGWRAVPLPHDPAARLAQLMHLLREHRGGLHLVAVVALGLTPLQAILSGKGGTGNATFFGWEEPFEDISGHLVARSEAEALTDRLVAPAYDVLGHDERVELLELLQGAADAVRGPDAA